MGCGSGLGLSPWRPVGGPLVTWSSVAARGTGYAMLGRGLQDSVKEMVGRKNARFCFLFLVCFPSFAPGLSLLPPPPPSRIRVTLSTGFPPGLVSTERLCIVLGS